MEVALFACIKEMQTPANHNSTIKSCSACTSSEHLQKLQRRCLRGKGRVQQGAKPPQGMRSWSHQQMQFLGTEDDQHLVSAASGTYTSLPADTLLHWRHTELVFLHSCTRWHMRLSLAAYGHILTLDSQLVQCHKLTLPVVTQKFSRTENVYTRGEKWARRMISSRCW